MSKTREYFKDLNYILNYYRITNKFVKINNRFVVVNGWGPLNDEVGFPYSNIVNPDTFLNEFANLLNWSVNIIKSSDVYCWNFKYE